MSVAGKVVSPLFLSLVKAPVVIEVTTGPERAQLKDGLRAVETPSGTRNVHSVVDEVATGTLDHACRDRIPASQVLVVTHVGTKGQAWSRR